MNTFLIAKFLARTDIAIIGIDLDIDIDTDLDMDIMHLKVSPICYHTFWIHFV